MTLEEMFAMPEVKAFFDNFQLEVEVEEDEEVAYKGYCPECEHYVCHCVEYNLA